MYEVILLAEYYGVLTELQVGEQLEIKKALVQPEQVIKTGQIKLGELYFIAKGAAVVMLIDIILS